MKIKFDSISESSYFKEVAESNISVSKEKIRNKITIGKLNKRSKSEYQNIEMTLGSLNVGNDIHIYIHQLKNDGFYDNKVSLLHTLSYLKSKGFGGVIKIFIITDHYNYYYKEFFSAIFCDTDFQNSFKVNTLKTALTILIQKYFGFRLAHFLKITYHRMKRFLRR